MHTLQEAQWSKFRENTLHEEEEAEDEDALSGSARGV